jgi:membrane protein YqaA with SNARE-associated domain
VDVLLLALNAFVSATLLPGASELVLAGLVAAGTSPVWLLFLAATIGNVAGSMVNWALGTFLAAYRERAWFPVKPAQYARMERIYGRWGIWSLLLSWVPVIGDPLTAFAGLMRAPFWPALAVITLAKAGRYAVVIAGVWGVWGVWGV